MWPIPQASQEKVLATWVRIFTRIAPRLIYIARLSLGWTDSNREITTTNDGGWTAWYVKILALGSLENTCWCLLNARMLSVFQSGSVTARIHKWREKLQVRWIYELTKTWKCNFITQHLIHGDLRALAMTNCNYYDRKSYAIALAQASDVDMSLILLQNGSSSDKPNQTRSLQIKPLLHVDLVSSFNAS